MRQPKPLPIPPQKRFPNKPLPKPPGKPLPTPPEKTKATGIGLLEAMQQCYDGGIPLGVLVIDEHEGSYPEAAAQLRVLQLAQALGQKVIIITINPDLKYDARSHVVNTRREFLPYAHQVVNKPFLNAFDAVAQPDLQRTLTLCGLHPNASKLVVMGQKTNQCVRLTAVGGRDRPSELPKPGATGRGYMVMSCSQILRDSSPATWSGNPGVEFYPYL